MPDPNDPIDCTEAKSLIAKAFDLLGDAEPSAAEEMRLRAHLAVCAEDCKKLFDASYELMSREAGHLLGYRGDSLDEQYEEYVRRSLF